MSKRLRIKVEGLVQGVSFRVGALRMARRLRLTGFAKNDSDGSVLVEIEGQPAQLDQFIDWCRNGPPLAQVSNVSFEEIKPLGTLVFNIL
jgi:acylphosphatase